jgi:hypothetical protein
MTFSRRIYSAIFYHRSTLLESGFALPGGCRLPLRCLPAADGACSEKQPAEVFRNEKSPVFRPETKKRVSKV